MATHRQRHINSTFVRPPRFHTLPERPKYNSPLPKPLPLMHTKPRCICRNFIFGGHCRDKQCPRAHVPHNAMVDLFEYLLERRDCPFELRLIRGRFVRPVPGMSRTDRPSDLICSDFLERDGFCQWQNRCVRAHLRPTQIYNTLLQSLKSIEPKTSVVALVSEDCEDPVVKLPEKTNYTTQQPSLVDNIPPLNVTIQLPTASFPNCEPTLTETNVLEPHQCSVVHPLSEVIVRLPKVAELQQASSAGSSVSERQDNVKTLGHSPDVSEESSTESSLDPNSVDDESTFAGCSFEQPDNSGAVWNTLDVSEEVSAGPSSDANSVICEGTITDECKTSGALAHFEHATTNLPQPTPATVSPPSELPNRITDPSVCIDWYRGRCWRRHCRYRHFLPLPPTQAHGDNIAVQQALPRQAQHDPLAVQKNTVLSSSSPKPVSQCAAVAASMMAVELDPAVIVASIGSNPVEPCPPYSQQNDPSAIPFIQAHTPSLQAHLPPKPQELPPLPRYTPPDGIKLTVMDSTHVSFSAGFAIEKISTGFESLWFVIEGVPESVGRTEIKRLASRFGVVQDVRIPKQSDKPISVQMTSYRQVVEAIHGLDGKDHFGRRIDVQLSLGKTLSKRMLRDNYVRVSWPVPCKAGYAGYSTLEAAQNAVSKADGKTERGYWITASMYESIPIIDAYNVRFTGLPPWVEQGFLDKFGPSEGTMLERPNHQSPSFGVPAVRKTLESFGKIIQFHVVPPPYKDLFVRAWCQFESPDVAAAACELNQVPQHSLRREKISVRRVLSVLEHVPRSKFELVEKDVQRLQQTVWEHSRGTHLDILPRNESDKTTLRLVAEDSKMLSRLRGELREILNGEILRENGQQVWDDFLRREAGIHFIEQLRSRNPDVLISVHFFRRCVRLTGTVKRRQPVAAAILDQLSSLQQHKVHVIPLDRQAMSVVASPDLAAAQQRHGEENIRVDFRGHNILVRGPDNLYEEVQQIVHTVKLRHVADLGGDNCPVCLEPPLTPVSPPCGHKWCKACFVSYLTAAADTRSFPISCLGDQGKCTELIPMKMARDALPPADFDGLALAAFHAYVQARPVEYHYCPTPDCAQAYPTGPRNAPLSCPECLARICPSCHVEYHEGITCADREDGGDRLFQEWMRSHDVKKCPGCNAPIERAAGCNHMTCTRCHTHTCWVCLQTFAQGQGIYDHMREFHGGIGL